MKANIFDALQFATNAHSGQFRKGTKIPYIVHPVTVMQTLIEYGASDDAVMAGILHDTLEDTPTTVADLEQNFGKRITQLVIGASEMDKSLSWEERKEHTLDTLGKCDDLDLLMVTCADKFSNIRSIIADHKKFGDDVWTRFNRGYDLQKWYYGGTGPDICATHRQITFVCGLCRCSATNIREIKSYFPAISIIRYARYITTNTTPAPRVRR